MLGVPAVDEQHRILFAWYVALRSAPQVQQIAEGLNIYAARHFVDEEGWAADQGIDIAEHHNLHNELLTRLDALLNRADRLPVMSLLYDWLTTHVDIDDRKLVQEATRLDG